MQLRSKKIRQMINKQCSFILENDISDLQGYVIMRLDELVEEDGVILNGHGTHDWFVRVKNFIQTSNKEGICELLDDLDTIPYPMSFKNDVRDLLHKFCLS